MLSQFRRNVVAVLLSVAGTSLLSTSSADAQCKGMRQGRGQPPINMTGLPQPSTTTPQQLTALQQLIANRQQLTTTQQQTSSQQQTTSSTAQITSVLTALLRQQQYAAKLQQHQSSVLTALQ